MRYLTVCIHAAETGAFHPVSKRLAEEPSIRREAIHHVELLAEETVLTLAEGSGDRESYEAIMRESTHVDNFLVSGENRWMATSKFEARDPVKRLLEWHRTSDFVVEWPIKTNADGSVEITYLGTESAFQDLYDDLIQSTAFDADVIETGPYNPNAASLMRSLTTRQQEVLQTAVDEGYYNNPRGATHEDIADEVGIAPTTVGDHLREIESRVFDSLVR
jgi:hypothetical protein